MPPSITKQGRFADGKPRFQSSSYTARTRHEVCLHHLLQRRDRLDLCGSGRLRRATRFLSTPVDSRRLGTGAARRDEGVRAGPRASGAECVRGRVREGPRTNGKSKCSETRPMGAGRRQIESVALCVWQCHLRNVSTLSNRTHYRCQRPTILSRARMWYTVSKDFPLPFSSLNKSDNNSR